MSVIGEAFKNALDLIINFDPEIFQIVGLSLYVSGIAVVISTIFGIPLGILIGNHNFPGKNILLRIIYTLMSLPPVIAGLFLFLLFMRRGPLGSFQLNYTPTVMIIAQICLVTPIIIGLTYNIVREKAPIITKVGYTLGCNSFNRLTLLIREMRIGLITALVSGFGRAISEVGAVMIVGGNITGKTRVMTTYISQLKTMGDYATAIAVGLILLAISFTVNAILYNLQMRGAK